MPLRHLLSDLTSCLLDRPDTLAARRRDGHERASAARRQAHEYLRDHRDRLQRELDDRR